MNDRKVAIAIVAHPDDIEFQALGALLMLQKKGWEIHYMTVANGCCGSAVDDAATIAAKRRAECQASCKLCGAIWHPSICNDLEVAHTWDQISKVVSVIRDIKPSIIFTQAMDDYMEDHINSCRIAVTAAFSRGMLNAKCDPPREPIQDDVTLYHTTPHGLMDPLRHKIEPEFFVNITSVIDMKRDCLACHKSQKEWLDISQGMDAYLNSMMDFSAENGQRSGAFKYAEGFRRRSWLGFASEEIDPLKEALGDDIVKNEKYR